MTRNCTRCDVDDALHRLVGGTALVTEARSLRSEDGENPEYDRALVELVTQVLGLNHDDHGRMMRARILGLNIEEAQRGHR